MTREEEIKIAASKYIENNSLDGYVQISDHKDSFIEGVEWADNHPKSPWINAKDDLPCNHKELIVKKGLMTKRVIVVEGDSLYFDRMLLSNNEWDWIKSICPSYWFPIPEPPKE